MTQTSLLRLFVFTVLAAQIGLLPLSAAQGQVLEIGSAGVIVHDGPEITGVDGSTPIAAHASRSPAKRLRHVNRAAATVVLTSAAMEAELSPDLIEAVAWRESRFQPGAISPKGAIGEMQLMPATAQSLGVNPFDSSQNYRGGAVYLRSLLRRYDGDVMRALAAYNAGPRAVDHYNGMPPFKETRAYVADILNHMSERAVAAPSAAKR